jgi:DNA-binding GntR family transcriptional regulator
MQEKDLHSLAEKISKYALEMQTRYPTGSVVVSENDLAGALHRAPETIAKALGLLHSQQKAERAPLSGYWKLNVESD